jgi:hypothetical protein
MNSNIDENHSVIMKTDKIGLVWFLRFIKNQWLQLKKIQILRNFENKKLRDKPENQSVYRFTFKI